MKERPILFSAPMVRAILDGRKTMTRRTVRAGVLDENWPNVAPLAIAYAAERCPYGVPGDRLWVRETWQPIWATDSRPPDGLKSPAGWRIGYPATDELQEYRDPDDGLVARCKPSIHMPRWASRITLEITGVRVERLQDISEDDAIAEGVTGDDYRTPCEAFAALWNFINGGGWSVNPWVWVVEFRRLEQNVRTAE